VVKIFQASILLPLHCFIFPTFICPIGAIFFIFYSPCLNFSHNRGLVSSVCSQALILC
jgi:hypothetical protein